MTKLISTSYLPGYIVGAVILALAAWVFNINADISVIKTKQDTHEAMVAHKNTRQDQITTLTTKFEAHQHLASHPEGQKTLTAIEKQQVIHTTQLGEIQKQLDRIIDKLDAR